ncbi:hypothetical protein Val02_85460 [Virgisporangium aliadipatigenens]|uniref:Uncharacterized protein n=1 Tax=Virgisporangium aliadipatigenens TaxID=741659 RepID=A0A8J3YXM3_9ACTN|nr:hypothetical protein Val02_85460 [Virgisporangium aliadipatigenens]
MQIGPPEGEPFQEILMSNPKPRVAADPGSRHLQIGSRGKQAKRDQVDVYGMDFAVPPPSQRCDRECANPSPRISDDTRWMRCPLDDSADIVQDWGWSKEGTKPAAPRAGDDPLVHQCQRIDSIIDIFAKRLNQLMRRFRSISQPALYCQWKGIQCR